MEIIDMTMKKFIFTAVLLSSAFLSLAGQNRTSYFVRNSTQSHNMNAAFVPEQGYVGFPFLSNIDFDLNSNLGPSDFLYNLQDGTTGLFLNKEIPSEVFLGNLVKNNFVNMGLSYSLINAGWFTGKHSFWSVDMGLDVDMDANLPLEAFRFLKEGMTSDPSSYSIRNLSMTGDVYAYVSVGYSRDLEELVDGLRVGAKARFIASVSSVDMNIEQLDIDMSSGKWAASSKAYANIYSGLLDFGFDESGMLDLSRTSFSPTGFVSGMGASFDIGAEYTISEGTPVDGLRFSVSVTDLGFISHMADMTTSVESAEGIQFEGVDHINDPDMDINGELSGLMDDLYSMLAFKKKDVTGNQTRMLAATLYGGIDYTFLHDKMNVGLLYSARFGRYRTDHELTLAWNYAPSKKFDIALSYSFLRNASSIGWLITFTPKNGIGLFVGSDYTSLKYDALSFSGIKIPVPSNLFIDFNFGFTISLGRNQRPDAD